jgi:hypothetical protein
METGRNWQGWAALLLAGLALFVALSGHLNFSFSLSDGGATAVAPAPALRIEKNVTVPDPAQGGPSDANGLQALQDELNQLRAQLGEKGQAIPVPGAPGPVPQAPQAPSLKVPMPNPPAITKGHFGWHNGGFGPFGGGRWFGGLFALPWLPLLGLGLLIWFLARRGRGQGGQAARRATTPLAPAPPEGPPGGHS